MKSLLLQDETTTPLGLAKAGEPVEGVQKLIACPDLASAGQAAVGITLKWTHSESRFSVEQYSAIYQGISGKDVVEQVRTASSTCQRGPNAVPLTLEVDEYFYSQEGLPMTKPYVDRYSYCVINYFRERRTCTSVLAKGDRVTRVTVDSPAERVDGKSFDFAPLAQAVTDRLVA
ncbi:MAG: hypothetical protein ABIQ18_34345 [Umezawaea sp.]